MQLPIQNATKLSVEICAPNNKMARAFSTLKMSSCFNKGRFRNLLAVHQEVTKFTHNSTQSSRTHQYSSNLREMEVNLQ